MVDRILEFIFSSTTERVFAGIVALVIMFWGKLQKKAQLSTPVALVYGVVMFASLLILLNQVGWEPPLKIKIRQWLDELGYSVKDITDKDSHFWFETLDHQKRLVYVTNRKDERQGWVVVSTGLSFEQIVPRIEKLDRKTHENLISLLRVELAKLGVHYSNVQYPLKSINIQYQVPASSITQDSFVQAMASVTRGLIVAREQVRVAVGAFDYEAVYGR